MVTNEDILAAVFQLDAANDEHWTADGQPRLDAVENILGSSASRKLITGAAPEYNRGFAQNLLDSAHDEETAGPTDTDGDDATEEVPNGQDEAPELDTDVEVPEFEEGADVEVPDSALTEQAEVPDEVVNDKATETGDNTAEVDNAQGPDNDVDLFGYSAEEYDDQIQRAEDEVAQVRIALNEGRQYLEASEAKLAELRDAKNQAYPPMNAAEAIKDFQQSEHRRRAELRGDAGTVSALDRAMQGRRKARVPGVPKREG